MLIKDEVLSKIRTGEVTVLFRRWSRPGAKAGGTQMTQGGGVVIDSVESVSKDEVTERDARESGYGTKENLLSHLNYRDDPIYRIRVYWVGEDPRIALRADDELSDAELAEVLAKLEKLD